ncbi:flavin reductase family protein [Gordonia soli]|uniref:Putative oxidoreductase n=1 Tax=Gordonia soli NBRC 108243 TaxID=1223545 RepID=M0QFM0_9ACTN|nr:flavin reductase family protein [Gordonia soli]GAC67390.1 putative oxidoreductase [Gordonia soli NBRC 108243]
MATTTSPAGDSEVISGELYRDTLSRFCTGVAVITSMAHDETPVGLAVGSFTSVSLDPPLVAAFVAHTSTTFPRIAETGRFCANVLGHHQQEICRRFARSGGDKFAETNWSASEFGTARLDDAVAWIDAEIDSVQRLGDHDLVVGRVVELRVGDESHHPLVFYRSGFHSLVH